MMAGHTTPPPPPPTTATATQSARPPRRSVTPTSPRHRSYSPVSLSDATTRDDDLDDQEVDQEDDLDDPSRLLATPLLGSVEPVDATRRPPNRRSHRRHSHDAIAFTCFHRSSPPSSHRRRTMAPPQLGKQGVIVLLCLINLFNYVDRGIIPGSPEKFQHFISRTLHVEPTGQGFYLGLLASAFIASYSIFSMVFGYWATRFRPFRMIALGMSVWIVAVVCCGVAHALDSYYFLMFGRILSGVGEASFQCNATPFINTHAPTKNRTLWMGVYLASITVGTAMGYIYGSVIASSSLTWAAAFYIEALIMALLIACCLYCVPSELDTVPGDEEEKMLGSGDVHHHEFHDKPLAASSSFVQKKGGRGFFAGWWEIFRDPTFLLIVLGHAAYTFSLAALSVFSPVILIGLGMYEKETQVATAFGGLIVVTGTVGTPLGGILLDFLTKRGTVSSAQRAYTSVKIIFVLMAAAFAVALAMMGFTHSRMAFLSTMAVCFLCLCALTPAETVAVMELFPESRHAMAIAANTLVIHALGDVPSPIILGYLKDKWAPRCGTIEIDGEAVLNPDCYLDRDGLKDVLLFPVLWLVWGVVLWGAATIVLRRRQRNDDRDAMHSIASISTTPTHV